MKRAFALLLAVVFIVALFAGCGDGGTTTTTPDAGNSGTTNSGTTNSGTTNSGTTNSGTTDSGDSGSSDTPVDEGPYKFAAGKFEQDEQGIAQTDYVYDVPFCTSDEVLTYWTTNWTPQLIPEEGFTSLPYPQMLKELTGVNVEWVICPSSGRSEQYSVLVASDDLCDIMGQAGSYHPDPIPMAIEDGYYANLYEYIDYMPNYTYQIKKWDYDKDVYNKIFYDATTIAYFYGMIYEPVPRMGYCIRGDHLDTVGLSSEGMDTYDEVHNALLAIQAAGISEHPMDIVSAVEQDFGLIGAGYGTYMYCRSGTLPSARVVDGKALFTLTDEDDRDAMTMLSTWYSEGLINPNWASIPDATALSDRLGCDDTSYVFWQPSGITANENNNENPDCRWDWLPRPRVNDGDYLKISTKVDKFSFASSGVSGKCENIPLAVSWCDWFYSEEGGFRASYGPEGLCWNYNEEGNIRYTDFILNNENGVGMSWMCASYGLNGLADHGMLHSLRSCCYEGGDFIRDWSIAWAEPSGEKVYDWPVSCKFTPEETEEIAVLSGDLTTYIGENWLAFVDGSAPMSQWDAYAEGCYNVGMAELLAIYQAAYDRFMAS